MQVDLAGYVALLAGRDNVVAKAIADALTRGGAHVVEKEGRVADAAVAYAVDLFGKLDMLVACLVDDADEVTSLVHAAAPPMRAAARGRIVTVASVAGLVPLRGEPAHAVAQSSLFMLTRATALEQGAAGILVNAVAVGAVRDDDGGITAADQRMLSHNPLGRAGTPQEIADAVLFLLDPENTYMTGHVLAVDGGWSIGFGRDF